MVFRHFPEEVANGQLSIARISISHNQIQLTNWSESSSIRHAADEQVATGLFVWRSDKAEFSNWKAGR
jgi:hypothetical protein